MVRISPSSDTEVPLTVLTDSYKSSHPFLYPPATERVAYGEFRRPFDGDLNDQRILFYGLQYIIDNYICRQWTQGDIERGEKFYNSHNIGYTPFPFPKELFSRIVNEHGGWFPVRIEGLPEGEIIYPHTPVYVITSKGDFSGLVTWLETLLTMVWYPSTVATLSRRTKDLIEEAFKKSVDPSEFHLIESRLHDFGFRGCTSVEQAMIGGTAHLLNFTGSDTALAAYHVQYHLNNGDPIAQSIPATEHSVMTAHINEQNAILKCIDEFGDGVFACVMDSYDYLMALSKILPSIAQYKMSKGGFMVIRPDSGDPLESILNALDAASNTFGFYTNSLGYKVLKGCSVIQGDGINYHQVNRILNGVMEAQFSAQNIAFGMGSSLLHRVNRDTMSFATKLSLCVDIDGEARDICKTPKTDPSKTSLPGKFSVKKNEDGLPIVYPQECSPLDGAELLKVYFDYGPIPNSTPPSFKDLKEKINFEWHRKPKVFNPVSKDLAGKISKVQQDRN